MGEGENGRRGGEENGIQTEPTLSPSPSLPLYFTSPLILSPNLSPTLTTSP